MSRNKVERISKMCKYCNVEFTSRPKAKRQFCSPLCRDTYHQGKSYYHSESRISLNTNGYLRYSSGPYSKKYVHRVMAEQIIGRPLKRDEHVHHIDGNKKNNTVENILILTNHEHQILEKTLKDKVVCCPVCNKQFLTCRISHKKYCSKECKLKNRRIKKTSAHQESGNGWADKNQCYKAFNKL